ncbi:hypothetical protein H2201_000619 [Coniosporium apollinis]|uniref:Mis18 domain-containing protein n=1 Tax=Coniosporium apollinis TaxID=61459 RepID=A0ABQ9P4F7_9PEZI|nr:hypothetical protein H2201_000619 [Coniosporium apollinis]
MAPARSVRESTTISESQPEAEADAESQSSDEEVSRSTNGFCRKCNSNIGEFYNGWIKITKTYYLPALVGSYSVPGLQLAPKAKVALIGSEFEGCTLQALNCRFCTENTTLGILCTQAPEEKAFFEGREFFKLPRIELRSEASGKVVQEILEPARPEYQLKSSRSTTAEMDIDGHPRPLEPVNQLAKSRGSFHQPNPPANPIPNFSPQPPPSTAPTESTHTLQNSASAEPQNNPSASTGEASARPSEHTIRLRSPIGQVTNNFRHYVPEDQLRLDPVARLQTEVSQNAAALASQQQHVAGWEEAFGRLQMEMGGLAALVETMRRELLARPIAQIAPPPPPPPPPPPVKVDETLEVFSATLSNVAAKVTEVDALKMQLEIMKRKIQRIEEGSVGPGSAAASFNSPREPSFHGLPHPPQPSHHVRRVSTPMRSDIQVQSSHQPAESSFRPSLTSDVSHQTPQTQAASSGWTSVNPSHKRGPSHGLDGHADATSQIGSPKRPKLAPLEPQLRTSRPQSYDTAAGSPIVYSTMETTESGSRYVPTSSDARQDSNSTAPISTTFIPYDSTATTADRNPDDSWRPTPERAPQGPSPKRGGRGGRRGGRPRQSLPPDLGTPEWEKPDWTGSQIVNGYYQPHTPGGSRRGGPVRRGSGGARHPETPARPSSSSGPPSSSAAPGNPYSHTKRTRTKPVRNAEGILIRKDGRPDMRSQSSAANLRKVHARKEAEKAAEFGQSQSQHQHPHHHTPTSALANAPVLSRDGLETPSPGSSAEPREMSTQERHAEILSKIFPRGIESKGGAYDAASFFPGSSPVRRGAKAKTERVKFREEAVGAAREGERAGKEDGEGDDMEGEGQGEMSPASSLTVSESGSGPGSPADGDVTMGEPERDTQQGQGTQLPGFGREE